MILDHLEKYQVKLVDLCYIKRLLCDAIEGFSMRRNDQLQGEDCLIFCLLVDKFLLLCKTELFSEWIMQ